MQHVVQPTHGNNCLGLVLANVNVVHCEVDDGYFESDHRHVSVTVSVSCPIVPRVTRGVHILVTTDVAILALVQALFTAHCR